MMYTNEDINVVLDIEIDNEIEKENIFRYRTERIEYILYIDIFKNMVSRCNTKEKWDIYQYKFNEMISSDISYLIKEHNFNKAIEIIEVINVIDFEHCESDEFNDFNEENIYIGYDYNDIYY